MSIPRVTGCLDWLICQPVQCTHAPRAPVPTCAAGVTATAPAGRQDADRDRHPRHARGDDDQRTEKLAGVVGGRMRRQWLSALQRLYRRAVTRRTDQRPASSNAVPMNTAVWLDTAGAGLRSAQTPPLQSALAHWRLSLHGSVSWRLWGVGVGVGVGVAVGVAVGVGVGVGVAVGVATRHTSPATTQTPPGMNGPQSGGPQVAGSVLQAPTAAAPPRPGDVWEPSACGLNTKLSPQLQQPTTGGASAAATAGRSVKTAATTAKATAQWISRCSDVMSIRVLVLESAARSKCV